MSKRTRQALLEWMDSTDRALIKVKSQLANVRQTFMEAEIEYGTEYPVEILQLSNMIEVCEEFRLACLKFTEESI